MYKKLLIGLTLFLLSVNVFAAAEDAAIKINWGYKGNIGPERWGQLSPDFVLCSTGKAQSPINVTKKVVNANNILKINYTRAPLAVVNDGITELQIGKQQLRIRDGHGVQVNFSPQTKENITFADTSYRLIELHIHTPSENQWHGQSFPLEIHFVHQGEDGKLAVIGVLAKGGDANTELEKIITSIPNDKGVQHIVPKQEIDPGQLLPSQQDYFSFTGSLTTPPCTEGVEWILMANPITVSPAQIAKLKRAIGGVNARSIQKIKGRQVFFNSAAVKS